MKPHALIFGAVTSRQDEQFEANFTVHRSLQISDMAGFYAQNGANIEYVATNGHDGFPPALYEKMPNLKVISSLGVGYDAIDANFAAAKGVVVTHTPNVLNADVANTTIMMMLGISRRLVMQDDWARSGKWAKNGDSPLMTSIEGKPVGIVGLGRIGKTIGEKLKAFNCQISYHTRTQKDDVEWSYYPSLVEMAKAVDYLIVITPGGPSTKHLINADIMKALGPTGTLINVARGSVVDELALIEVLQSGDLGAAALDVFENEPKIPEALCKMENTLLVPHIGSATIETRIAMADLVVTNLITHSKTGKAETPVPECAHL